jgi:vanillate O-demethylase ferredoxin subunit
MTMEVPDLAEVRIDLELPEGGVKGLVLNEEGGPVPGSSVSLRSLAASTSGGGMFGSFLSRESRTRRASVNEQGEFEFDRLEAGNYELVATGNKSDYSPSEPVRATVVASRVEGGVVLRLLPALVIKGVVVDEAGAAIADARLVATKVGEGAGAARGGATAKSAADGSFEVHLQKSGQTLKVGKEQSILSALQDAGHEVPFSCSQGVCGTCITRVLEGECDHRDMYLTDDEKARHDQFLPCCSRARSPLLVLDL